MSGPLRGIDAALRGRPDAWSWWMAAACGMGYGAVMGSFGGRPAQMAVSALKAPLLLAATTALSLPSFFILNTLLGVRGDFGMVLRAVAAAQAVLMIVLAAFAPLTLLWYASSGDYQAAVLFNGLMFAAASVAAQWRLRRAYQPLIARRPVHRRLLGAWLAMFAFVGVQMGWVLRPFVGDRLQPVEFFRREAWDNAYVIVARLAWDLLQGP